MSVHTEPRSLQLIVANENLLQAVTFNYDDLKAALDDRLEQYRSLVVSEDAISAAKQDRANLNKLEAALKAKQQEIERRLLGDFSQKLKELRTLISSASKSIDEQIKYFEQAAKDEKKAKIETIYSDNIGDLSDLIPFSRLFESSWLNTTARISKVEKELLEKIDRVQQDMKVLNELDVDKAIEIPVKDHYLRTLDLSSALMEKTRLEKAAADLSARQKRREDEELLRRRMDRPDPSAVEPSPQNDPAPITDQQVPPVQQLDFRVWVTPEQKKSLADFLRANGIRYGKVTL